MTTVILAREVERALHALVERGPGALRRERA
jgi:hypothetical protein